MIGAARDLRVRGEDRRRLLGGEMEHVADREPEVADVERRRLEARSAARLARRDDVGQERHLVRDRALPVAGGAAPAAVARC